MRSLYKLYQVDKTRIGFLKFIFEAHDGIAVITTLDARQGLVRFAVPPGCMEDVTAIVTDLQKDIFIREVTKQSDPVAQVDDIQHKKGNKK